VLHLGAQVAKQQIGDVHGEAAAHDDAQRRKVLTVLGERVGRHLPAALAQRRRHVEHRVVLHFVFELEGEHREFVALRQELERAHLGDRRRGVHGHLPRVPLDTLKTGHTELEEGVVLGHDLRPGTREVEREGRHVVAQVVDPEDEVLGERLRIAPHRPADAGVHESVLVTGGIDGLHARHAEVPLQVGVEERGDEAARRPVDVDRDVESGALLQVVEQLRHALDVLVAPIERRAQHDDDPDGVLVAELDGLLGREVVPLALHGDEPHLHVPVIGELVPAHLDVDAGHEVGLVGRLALGPALLLPATLEGEAAEHRRLARAGGRAAGRLVRVGSVPEPADHVDATHLHGGGLRVFVLVDHVLVERLGHQLVGERVHVGGHEGRDVQAGVAVEHEFVVDDLVGHLAACLFGRQPAARNAVLL